MQTITRIPSVSGSLPSALVAPVEALGRTQAITASQIVFSRAVEPLSFPYSSSRQSRTEANLRGQMIVRVEPAVHLVISEAGHRAALGMPLPRSLEADIANKKRERLSATLNS